jgi:regulator of replication initiation timing
VEVYQTTESSQLKIQICEDNFSYRIENWISDTLYSISNIQLDTLLRVTEYTEVVSNEVIEHQNYCYTDDCIFVRDLIENTVTSFVGDTNKFTEILNVNSNTQIIRSFNKEIKSGFGRQEFYEIGLTTSNISPKKDTLYSYVEIITPQVNTITIKENGVLYDSIVEFKDKENRVIKQIYTPESRSQYDSIQYFYSESFHIAVFYGTYMDFNPIDTVYFEYDKFNHFVRKYNSKLTENIYYLPYRHVELYNLLKHPLYRRISVGTEDNLVKQNIVIYENRYGI